MPFVRQVLRNPSLKVVASAMVFLKRGFLRISPQTMKLFALVLATLAVAEAADVVGLGKEGATGNAGPHPRRGALPACKSLTRVLLNSIDDIMGRMLQHDGVGGFSEGEPVSLLQVRSGANLAAAHHLGGNSDHKCMKECVTKGALCKGIFIAQAGGHDCHMVLERSNPKGAKMAHGAGHETTSGAANVAYHNSPNPNVKDEQFSPLQPKATSHKAVKAKQAAGAKAAAKQEVAAGKGAGVLKPK